MAQARHGWLIVDKPLGVTSAGVVGRVKRLVREAGWGKVKVGHGGTLDPLATGVLPIALGEATKLAGRMLDATKAYRFTVAFGSATASEDAEGAVVATSAVRPTLAAVRLALAGFTGEIAQVPPAYSALKVDGERAYARARAGEAVELAARRVTVFSMDVVPAPASLAHPGPLQPAGEGAASPLPPFRGRGLGEGLACVTLEVVCSKGTYVRSLARDLALAVGTVGHVTMLRRTRAGPFGEERALTLDKLAQLVQAHGLEQALEPLTAGLDDIPALAVEPQEAAALRQGKRLAGRSDDPGTYLATDGAVPVALVDVSSDGVRVVRGFNL